MKEFYSLREFLLLKDPLYKSEDRSIFNESASPEYWVKRYDLAKSSYEEYGQEGPPINSQVITLVSGHGGCAGVQRKFIGIYKDDERFFAIEREDINHWKTSLVLRDYWWASIIHKDNALLKNKEYRMFR